MAILLQNNADVDVQGKDGCTPLYLSCKNGHDRVLKRLLRKNAKFDYHSVYG